MYEGFEAIHSPRLPNIMSAADSALWKAVRAGVAPCLSNTNLKKVCMGGRGLTVPVRGGGGMGVLCKSISN
jgi:hypothetical protein